MPRRVFQSLLAAAALALTFGTAARAMTFETIAPAAGCEGRVCILASGDIDRDASGKFSAFLKANKIGRGALVVLDSQGGNLVESLKLGEKIRDAGLSTAVQAYDRKADRLVGGECASACAYVFVGGVERTVAKGSRIGVHQVYTAGDSWAMSAADGLELMSLVAEHINRLCGKVTLLIPALKTRPDDMHWLNAGELTRYAVVTTATANG